MQLPASNHFKSLLDFRHSLIIRRRHMIWSEEIDHKPVNSVLVERRYRLAFPKDYFTTSVPQPKKALANQYEQVTASFRLANIFFRHCVLCILHDDDVTRPSPCYRLA